MEGPEKDSCQVPPIATTPPRSGLKEELLSQSSSGTQISNASGLSLGEAIRRRSTVNQEMEAWFQPHAEMDTSNQIAALGRRRCQTSGTCDLTEFPSMEEGSITLTEDSRRQQASNVTHTPLLKVEDSHLSPNLPLMTTYSTQGRTFFNETLFQQTGMDFAPLRETPDTSDASEETASRLQMREAVRLAATDVSSDSSLISGYFSLSQHPMAFSTMAPTNTSLGSCLSQHPLSLSGHIPVEQRHSEKQMPHFDTGSKTNDENSEVLGSQKLLSQRLATSLPPKESWGIVSGQDLFLLDSNVPTPLLLDMLEKEVGLSQHCGFLSSESSSCKSVLGKDPEENEMSPFTENVVPVERESETFVEPHGQERTIPECDSLKVLFDSEGKPFRNASDLRQLPANVSQVSSRGHRIGLGDPCIITEISPRPLLNRQVVQQVSETVSEEQKKLVSTLADGRLNVTAPFQPVFGAAENGDTRSMVDIQMGSKSELTLSDFIIETEHKDTGTSPSFNEGSFFGHLAHPIHHSTPGIFTNRSLKQKVPGTTGLVKSVLQSSLPCLYEEISKSSCASTFIPSVEKPRVPSADDTCVPSAGEQLTLHSGQESKNENSDGFQVLHPLKGRIQSLPSLNFMEKVGAWNVSQSAERMSDALALYGSSGISPRQKAYSAIAGSLNRILLEQQSQVDLKAGLVASFCGPNSMTNLHPCNQKSPRALLLSRSQSENSVIAIGREMSRAEIDHETHQDEGLQPTEDKGSVPAVSGVNQRDANIEDPLIQCYTALLVSTVSSDEETSGSICRGRGSNPDNFISSERVAELLREDASCLSGSQDKSDSCQDNNTRESPGFHLCTNQISPDHFRDVSPDSLNQVISSGTGSCADLRLSSRQSSRHPSARFSAASGKLCSSLEEVFRTPDDREINIEERIPVYLHNLGIDQSPSSILTPFMPRGPVREIEFSPTELRTLKTSNDLLTQHLQLSEGDSCSMVDAMQSSFNSSILVMPAPAGADTAPGTPLATELSPQPSRDLLNQCSTVCHQLELHAPTPQPAEGTSESPAAPRAAEQSQVIQGVPSNFHSGEERSTKCVQILMDRFDSEDSKELGTSREQLSSSSLSCRKGEKSISEKGSSSSVIPEGEKYDFFIGSETLMEIQKLLAEAEARSPSRNFKSASSISSADLGCSLNQMKKMDGSEGFGSVKGSSPGLQRIWSWDETLTRQNVHKDSVLAKTISLTGSLKWDGLLAVDVLSNEQILPEQSRPPSQVAEEEHKMKKPVRRSEPEGCLNVNVNKSLPVFVGSAAESTLFALKGLPDTSSIGPLDSISDVLGKCHQVLEKTRKETVSSHESENSSSVDSLGIKVKKLLQCNRPVLHAKQWIEGEKPNEHSQTGSSVGASAACSKGNIAQESANGSSLDSLAVRVKTLLEDECPVMHAAQILQSAEEEEEKAHAWVKLKLTVQPADSVPDLNEEDRQIIEEIKREQFLSTRKAEIVKDRLWGNNCERISSHSSILKTDTELSKTSSDNELHKDIQPQNPQLVEFPGINAVQARPGCRNDHALPSNPDIKPLYSDQSHVCNQLKTPSENLLDSSHSFQAPLCHATDTCLLGLTGTAKAIIGEEVSVLSQAKLAAGISSTESAKQITSITFASRKRLSSSLVPCTSITEPIPCGLVPFQTQPISNEQLKPGENQVESLQPCASTSTTAVHVPDKSVGFPSGGEKHEQLSIVVSKDEYPRENVENSQTSCIDQKVHLITENHEETQAASQVLSGLRRYKPLVNVYHNRSNPEDTTTDPLLSINAPQQKTENASHQECLTDGLQSFVHSPKPLLPTGKESTLSEESTSTSDEYLCRVGARDTGSSSPLPSSSPDCMPVSPSSPIRKALSGVHITLSPKHVDLGLSSLIGTGAEMSRVDGLKSSLQPTTLNSPTLLPETTSNLKTIELSTNPQDTAYFPRSPSSPDSHFKHSSLLVVAQPVSHLSQEPLEIRQYLPVTDQVSTGVLGSYWQNPEDNLKTTASSQTEKMSSDAITQITTESPEKTTYSAEIFVSGDSGDMEALRTCHRKNREILSTTTAAVNQASILNRQTDKPLLLPYKPPGSSEMYYVPCPKETLRLSRVRSETTMESSHSGSNDAIPPNFPAQALGSGDENSPDTVAVKHREGIYSKRAAPKDAWADEKATARQGAKESVKIRNSSESVQTTHSVFRSAQFYLHHPVPLQHEIDFLAGSQALGQYALQEHQAFSSKDIFQYNGISERSQASFSLHQPTGEERFSALKAELDYSLAEESRSNKTLEGDSPREELKPPDVKKSGYKMSNEQLLPSSQRSSFKEKQVADLPVMQSAHFTSSLDELWAKYLERQKQHQQHNPGSGNSRNELSLVQRLDRLARLLQNPIRHSLVPASDEQSNVQEEPKGKETKKIISQGNMACKGNLATHSSIRKVEERPDATSDTRLSKSRHHKIGGTAAIDRKDRNLEQHQNSEILSDTSSEMRPVKDSSVLTDITSDSEITQLEIASQTGASGSISTIDTDRLIRAFGHDRVQVSPRLSQLYSTISLQKTRSEKWAKASRKGRAADYPKTALAEQKRKDAQATDSFISSDSVSTISSSHGPSPALSNKRSRRMLNKAVQAGDFEIVNSATKKHTRDVGLTFPTPTSSQARLRQDLQSGTEYEFAQSDGLIPESKGKQKRQPSRFLAEKRPRRNKPQWLQGVSWFVPAEDLKSDSNKGNGSSFIPDSGLSWFEALPNPKPWREPLREKNWLEDHSGLQVCLMAPARDVENKPPPPFVKMTLQESLALHRPDFISSSGERVKRLKLIMEERKLQSMLQGAREELFNPHEERRSYHLPNRDYRALQRKRAISKNEMVQRSKRIYEQLPEVRKRKEEEKRKSDYSTNRLKAQLYKTKITNRILGRKVPWE